MNNKSPLRYPGGKTRACETLITTFELYFDAKDFKRLMSPFFGGGSFEFYIQNKYPHLKIRANDYFNPLYTFWSVVKDNPDRLCNKLEDKLNMITKKEFLNYRSKILDEKDLLTKALMYFIINRCSFSGATLSGGFSEESSKKRFTKSSIERIKQLNLSRIKFYNKDFERFINKKINENYFIFLDPPYYLENKSNLYGNNGDLHQDFDHVRLFHCLYSKKNWMMTYNNCEFIRKLYKNFIILDASWSYGMNKSKESSEIVIISLSGE